MPIIKGLIASDIDGTITDGLHEINPRVVSFFENLQQQGWVLLFITGRTFQFGYSVLKHLSCPYYFAVQNGAFVLEMPSKKILAKKTLTLKDFSLFELICQRHGTDFAVYTGVEGNDIVYYRPAHFSSSMQAYLVERAKAFHENWVAVQVYENLPVKEVPSIKCIGSLETMQVVAREISAQTHIYMPVIQDPFSTTHYVAQGTHCEATKSFPLNFLKKHLDYTGPVIAAGDDYNDLEMLEAADIAIVMQTAPKELKLIADLIAPSATECGIIEGIERAIQHSR